MPTPTPISDTARTGEGAGGLPTPYYEDAEAGIVIYHGDCRAVLPYLPKCDIAVTSPPYNLGGEPWPHLGNWKPGDSAGGQTKWRNGSDAGAGIQYGTHNDCMPWPEYVVWQHDVLGMLWEKCDAIFYNHKPNA